MVQTRRIYLQIHVTDKRVLLRLNKEDLLGNANHHTMRHHFTPTRLTKMKKILTKSNVGRSDTPEHLHFSVGS